MHEITRDDHTLALELPEMLNQLSDTSAACYHGG